MKITIQSILALRNKWCDFLANDDLKQAKNVLADPDYSAFCCLGVAEEKLGSDFDIAQNPANPGTYQHPNPYYDPDDWFNDDEFIVAETNLHFVLREALGLSEEQERILMTLNDDTEAGFTGIANVVRTMNIHFEGREYDQYGELLIR